MANENANLSELQREAETSRADLMHTVDSLQSRVTPRALKEDIGEYVRDTGNSLLLSVEHRIRDNPLQAAAIATGLAYPLWRLVSSIPAPIVLIGAGIALTQGGGSCSGIAGGKKSKISNGSAADIGKSISDAADALGHQAAEVAGMAKEKMTVLGAQTMDAAARAMRAAEDFASDSATAGTDAASRAYNSGVELADKTAQDVELAFTQTKDRLVRAIEEHPLVAGGIGVLIGAFFASCIPKTAAEDSAFGTVSDDLKNKARNVVSEGVGVVKTAAGKAYDEAVKHTTEHGLTSDVVTDVIQDAGKTVQSAAHEAINRMAGSNQTGERK